MNYVIGSGPSAIMAARALLDAGAEVTIVDVGRECDPDRMSRVRALASLEVSQWEPTEVDAVRGPTAWDPTIPKLCFGSTFPYALEELRSVAQEGTKCLWSLARGGLSNVWGAAVLPNRSEDFEGWPVSSSEMAPHYRAAGEVLGIAGTRDELEKYFPFYAEPSGPAPLSRQGTALLERLQAHRKGLAAAGIQFGRARLAMRVEDGTKGRGCQKCGLCLSGCPYGALWNAADVLSEMLHRYPSLTYVPGRLVTRLSGTRDGVVLECRSTETGEVHLLEGARAFVGCGTIATAALVLGSLQRFEQPIVLQYQPYALIPLLALNNVPDVQAERLHTLSQVFIEVADPAISKNWIHLQLYTYNPIMKEHLHSVARLAPKGITEKLFLGRLMAIQAYFDSSEADGITLTAHAGKNGVPRLRLTASNTDRATKTAKKLVRKLLTHSADFGASPMVPAVRYGHPGEGNHIGGVFPMRMAPGELETDTLGRLRGLPGVHLIDAAVLPALSATTFTYTMMANAHRIATQVINGSA